MSNKDEEEILVISDDERITELKIKLRLVEKQLGEKLNYEELSDMNDLQDLYKTSLKKICDYSYCEQSKYVIFILNATDDKLLKCKMYVHSLFLRINQLVGDDEKLLDDLIDRVPQHKDILIKYKNINAQL